MKEDNYGKYFSSNVELLEDTRELTPEEAEEVYYGDIYPVS